MSTFADRLKELRKKNGVTQKQIAELLGIAERNYRRYEAGDVDPSASNVSKLADYFDVTIDYLTGRRNDDNSVFIDKKTKKILVDRNISLEAKGLYMQLRCYAFDNKVILPNEEDFLKQNKISKKEFDKVIDELIQLNYIKIDPQANDNNSEKIYIFTDDIS